MPPSSWSIQDVESWLVELTASINNGTIISPSRDIFEQGFDRSVAPSIEVQMENSYISSLHATFLRNRIAASLRLSSDPDVQTASTSISQNFVYEHPTLRELSISIVSLLIDDMPSKQRDSTTDIEAMLQTYGSNLPKPKYSATVSMSTPISVLLTGTTGSVGSHILAALLSENRVHRVYTLNRPSSTGTDRQAAAFAARDLPTDLLQQSKLVQLFGDVTQDHFGLTQAVFDEVSHRVSKHILPAVNRVFMCPDQG
jgi:hypothetical protein